MNGEQSWRRLHPLSPLVRGGRGTIGLAILVLPSLVVGHVSSRAFVDLGVVGFAILVGLVVWLVTRWRIDGDDLQIETGLLRRHSERYPLSQVQAVDIVQPGLARVFGLAELRLRMGGSTGSHARLAYLHASEVEPLRLRFLSLAERARGDEEPGEAELPPEERVLSVVPTGRLIGSLLISDVGLLAEALLAGLIVTAVYSERAAFALVSAGILGIVALGSAVWSRFNGEYQLTVAESSDGLLHVRAGLIGLTAETIRPGRVQAVRMVEPLLWRRLGWCRLELDLAGRQRKKGENRSESKRLRAVLPVGGRAIADELLDRLLPDRPREQSRPPRRAWWKSPLRYRWLAWGRTETCVVATSGRLRRVTCWVPLEKVQSFRRVQGPAQRRLRLANLHLDTAGRSLHATLRDRDVVEVDTVLGELCDLARQARAR
ncbi:MAG TPA: PH domain-containing protein [Gaiellaceae bacterium]|nr:PH domain-containing protein [Gaiellaceae bacterium]